MWCARAAGQSRLAGTRGHALQRGDEVEIGNQGPARTVARAMRRSAALRRVVVGARVASAGCEAILPSSSCSTRCSLAELTSVNQYFADAKMCA